MAFPSSDRVSNSTGKILSNPVVTSTNPYTNAANVFPSAPSPSSSEYKQMSEVVSQQPLGYYDYMSNLLDEQLSKDASSIATENMLGLLSQLGQYEMASVQAQIDADRSNAIQLQNWTSNENALNRQFQQASADKEMAFNAEQLRQAQEWSSAEAELARNFDADEAAKARDWSKMMSDTAMQRSVADMKAAGINPILAAGTPASTPSASAASVSGGPALPGATGAHANGSMTSAQKAVAQKAQAASVLGDVLSFVSQGLDRDQQMYFWSHVNGRDIMNLAGSLFKFSFSF